MEKKEGCDEEDFLRFWATVKTNDPAAQKHGAASAEQLALMVLRGDGMTLAERKEAGRLIDAVSDLLAACEKAKKFLEPDLVEPGRTVFWELVFAIAKAKGKA